MAESGIHDVVERAAAIMQAAIEQGYPGTGNNADQCKHGRFGFEDCIACYDEFLMAKVEEIRALSHTTRPVEWQAIETRPMTPPYLVFRPGLGIGLRVRNLSEGVQENATHWMALPTAPRSLAIEEGEA
jgi:hypothetical protein